MVMCIDYCFKGLSRVEGKVSRYSRQIAVRSVGIRGHSRIQNGAVTISGAGLDAQICALYLAGAGVGTITCEPNIAAQIKAINSEVQICESSEAKAEFGAVCKDESFNSDKPSELGRGSQVARDVIACFLRG